MYRLVKHLPMVLAAGLLLGWIVFLRPAALGGPITYTIVSGSSMEPVLHSGDLIIVRKQRSYDVGDIASYHVPEGQPGEGNAIVHRLVSGDGLSGYVTRGDNVARNDPWTPTDREIIGRLVFQVPKLGFVFALLHNPLAVSLMAGAATVYAILRRPRPMSRTSSSDKDLLTEV